MKAQTAVDRASGVLASLVEDEQPKPEKKKTNGKKPAAKK